MEIPNSQITHSLRTLGFEKNLGTGLSSVEYRKVVRGLQFDTQPSVSALTDAVRVQLEKMAKKDTAVHAITRRALRIRMIKSSLRVIGKDLDVSVSLSRTDYPEVIKLIEGLHGKLTPQRIAPIVANYIFGEADD